MTRTTIALALALPLALFACKGDDAGSHPGAAGSAAATGGAKPAATGAAATAGAAAATGASGSSASLTATDLPSPAGLSIGVPAGGKVSKSGDFSQVETDAYRLNVKPAKDKEKGIENAKSMLSKAPGYKAVVDETDGYIAAFDDKGGKVFMVLRYVKAGDQELSCESTMTKSPKDEAKAKEAYEVCGSLKKK